MKIIDLSMPFDEKIPAYPGDPQIEIKQIALIQKDGWSEKRIHFNSHCGTHIDAPSHMIPKGKNLDELNLDSFVGEGMVVDVRTRDIDESVLPKEELKNKVILFLTGQSEKIYKNYYENAKFISEKVAQRLVKEKVKAVGIDSFSVDESPYPIHKILLPHNIIIIENLIDLHKLPQKNFKLHYFPLRITNGDGGPCRAVAMIE